MPRKNTQVKETSHLPTIIIVLGTIEASVVLYLFIYHLLIIPQLLELYQELNIQIQVSNPYTKLLIYLVPLFFTLAEISYGLWLRKMQRTNPKIIQKHKIMIYSVLLITLLSLSLTFH